MFSRPTTDQILQGIANELRDAVAPEVRSEPVKVLLAQLEQVVRQCAVRAGHEVAWMHEEAAAIAAATGKDVGAPASLELGDVVSWYSTVSRMLSSSLDDAFAAGDRDRQAELKLLLDARSAHETTVLGAFEFVGRG